MSTRTVRLDEETEQALRHIVEVTGLSMSAALKKGLLTLQEEVAQRAECTPYDVYRTLDLGPGGYAITPSTQTRRGVQEAIRRKLRR